MLTIFFSFVISVLMIKIIIYTNDIHAKVTLDHDTNGVQKMHDQPVPRIGGLAIFVAMVFVSLYGANTNAAWSPFYAGLITSLFFVFVGGLTEDLSKAVSPIVRMGFMTFGVCYALFVSHSMPLIRHMAHDNIDWILGFDFITIFITWFAVIGVSNAYNIIDGFNGLSATAAAINLFGLMFLAYVVQDYQFVMIIASIILAICGFLCFNYPKGKIFLGDGGAYSIGFLIALLSLNLSQQYHHQMSPYAVLLLAIYPIMETVFSIVRRKFIHKTKAMAPDNLHLHQLVFDRCLPRSLPINRRNARVMPLMLMFMLPQTILVIFFYNSNLIILFGLLAYIVFYVYMYLRFIHFKTPKLLVFSK
ncbi:MAG: undecaprenyl/decaprenyl-phosphate alpha-N-acetylglucosaminyl 1-phosphate transferase [Neisseriaceae bacterium]|nr:MAG: undecaprenyl/decaprenyl-phosphate alpha-N-acetylglucosaminyl 1-phosphate transferase [Neisseriaceae bacterium]